MSRVDFDIENGYFEGEPFIEHDHLEDGDPPGKYVLFTDYDALTKALHTPPEAVAGESDPSPEKAKGSWQVKCEELLAFLDWVEEEDVFGESDGPYRTRARALKEELGL